MAVDVTTYLAQLNGKKGKLERWETDIFQLHHAGVSYQNIAEFLKLNGAESTKMEVYRFIHRKKRKHLLDRKPDTAAVPNIAASGESAKAPSPPEPASSPDSVQAEKPPSRPKFKFRESMGKDKSKW